MGELLWDVSPTQEWLGGAPANFAYMTAVLGDSAIVASRVGNDPRGHEALRRLNWAGVSVSQVQIDSRYATGSVAVELDEKGQAKYTIVEDVAWDYFEFSSDWNGLALRADAVCFGSLAQRSSQSCETIRRFLEATRSQTLIVFDVNLRSPFYTGEVLTESFKLTDIAKLNDEEMYTVSELFELPDGTEEECAKRLLERFDLKAVCVTRGRRGSLLITSEDTFEHSGFNVDVVDTVGAGDAFTAALVHHYLRGSSLEKISEAANRLGSWVASQAGATPQVSQSVLEEVVSA